MRFLWFSHDEVDEEKPAHKWVNIFWNDKNSILPNFTDFWHKFCKYLYQCHQRNTQQGNLVCEEKNIFWNILIFLSFTSLSHNILHKWTIFNGMQYFWDMIAIPIAVHCWGGHSACSLNFHSIAPLPVPQYWASAILFRWGLCSIFTALHWPSSEDFRGECWTALFADTSSTWTPLVCHSHPPVSSYFCQDWRFIYFFNFFYQIAFFP